MKRLSLEDAQPPDFVRVKTVLSRSVISLSRRAQANYGTSGQTAEQNAARELVYAAVCRMFASDRANVETIIRRNIEQ